MVLCSVLGGTTVKEQSLSSQVMAIIKLLRAGWGTSMSRHSRVRGCEQSTGPWHVIWDLPWELLESPCSVFFISLFFLLTLFYWLSHFQCKLPESRGHTWLIHHQILAPTTTLTDRRGHPTSWIRLWLNDQMNEWPTCCTIHRISQKESTF